MPLLIDGHNLIGKIKDISLADPDDEMQLLERLATYRRRKRNEITVVFDPSPEGGPPIQQETTHAGIHVIYAHPGQRADDVICRIVRRARNPGSYTVISSDHAVQTEVRFLGAQVIASQEFARRIARGKRKASDVQDRPLSAEEVDDWLRIFSEGKKRPPK